MTQVITTNDGTTVTSSDCGTCASYASPAAIYNIFGTDNVNQWADLDNLGNTDTIAGRLAWSLCLATNEIEARLLGGVYVVPFVAPVPCLIQDLVARLAGCLLYDARRIADLEGPDEDAARYDVQPHRRYCIDTTRAIRSGKRRLPGVAQYTTVPQSAARYMGAGGGNYNNTNPEAIVWLPFIWTPVLLYPPVGIGWPGCGGLLNWW